MTDDNWKAFLSDPTLSNNPDYHSRPAGRYLFGKILHDVLHCLNDLISLSELIVSTEESILNNFMNWLKSNKIEITLLKSEIESLWQYHQDPSISENAWPTMIQEIGAILDGIPALLAEFHTLNSPKGVPSNDFITMGGNRLRSLNAIRTDIQDEKYSRLWTTRKYWREKEP